MEQESTEQLAWKPLSSIERRVLGVLVEKAKTTPDAYPLTLNALRNGCNQKSNRSPQMDVSEDQLEDALENLRRVGATIEVQGGGRAAKYRHAMYEWMGVSKVEAAVMTELLLRGAQTVGELRGRAARMEPIPDLAALKPVVDALKKRGLIMGLTPEGRGHVVAHALFTPAEMEHLQAEYGETTLPSPTAAPTIASHPVVDPPAGTAASSVVAPPAGTSSVAAPDVARLENELSQLKAEFAAAQRQWEETVADLRQRIDDLERFRQDVEG
ncbi:MAG: YceH family protein [Pirellulales bacterium]|nr:YceH family protein [Pirellulales bacterium]